MLIGDAWCIEHIERKLHGLNPENKRWIERVNQENGKIGIQCDRCKREDFADSDSLALRRIYNKHLKNIKKWKEDRCKNCAIEEGRKQRKKLFEDPDFNKEYSNLIKEKLASIPEHRKLEINERRKSAIQAAYDNMTQEEKSRGVIKQWATMSEETKRNRADKIREWSLNFWSSMTAEERTQHIEKAIAGLPRSKASDDFKSVLIESGLYSTFESEVGISGFVVDEASHAKKIAIEFFGDYYHCNPRIYDDTWYNTTIKMTASEKWQYDRRRIAALKKAGYKVIIVWESDWYNNQSEVLKKIKKVIDEGR